MGFFFSMAYRIIDKERSPPAASQKIWCTFIVLMDMIARELPFLEYGRVSAVFPRNLINDAYQYLDAVHEVGDDSAVKPRGKRR
jgi:hypothetical protein